MSENSNPIDWGEVLDSYLNENMNEAKKLAFDSSLKTGKGKHMAAFHSAQLLVAHYESCDGNNIDPHTIKSIVVYHKPHTSIIYPSHLHTGYEDDQDYDDS